MADTKRDKSAYKILVTAPAGAGKTRVLASRYLKLLMDGEKPENIIAITFTRKAAGEMKQRIVDFLLELKKETLNNNIKSPLEKVFHDQDELNKLILSMRISTIDSFLSSIIRLFPGESGVNPNFKVIDEIEEEEIIDTIIDDVTEEYLESNKNFVNLMAFFNFRYDGFLLNVKRIVKNWEMYSETIKTVHKQSLSDIEKNILKFLSKKIDVKKSIKRLKEKVKEVIPLWAEIPDEYNEFLTFINNNSVEQLIRDEDKFMQVIEIFFRKDNRHLKVKLPFTVNNPTVKTDFEQIKELCGECAIALGYKNDIDNLRLIPTFTDFIFEVIRRLQKRKSELGVLGIGDLKTVTFELLTEHRERFNILYNMDAKVNHYLIDEFQDTDPIQWKIFQELTRDWFSGETAKQELNIRPTLFIVGDEKQSIYGFRNADVSIINSIKDVDDSFTVTLPLVKNFRSKKEIVESVNSMFREKMKRINGISSSVDYKRMEPNDTEGGGIVKLIKITLKKGKKEEQIPPLAEKVTNLIKTVKERHKSWDDIALLFRDSMDFHFFEKTFEKNNIPYISSGGKSFFLNREIREIIKIIYFLDNPYDDINFTALFLSPLFNHSIGDLINLLMYEPADSVSGETKSLFEIMKVYQSEKYADFHQLTEKWLKNRDKVSITHLIQDAIIDINGYGILVDRIGGQKYMNIRKLLDIIERISEDTTNFCFFFARLERVISAKEKNADIDTSNIDLEADKKGTIRLMTIHKAKGLEFPVVIIPEVNRIRGVRRNKGIYVDRDRLMILPLTKYRKLETELWQKYWENEKKKREEELKRLLYVALTRAKEELYLFLNPEEKGNIWVEIISDSKLPIADLPEMAIKTEQERILEPAGEGGIYDFSFSIHPEIKKYEIQPSEMEEVVKPYNLEIERAKTRGSILHKLFELLGKGIIKTDTEQDINIIVKNICHQMDGKFLCDNKMLEEIKNEFLKVINNEKINDNSEVSIINGTIDKIIFLDDTIEIYDYKTDKPGDMKKDEFIKEIKNRYYKQMEEYRFAVKEIFKKKNVKVFLILTSILEIVEIKNGKTYIESTP
ncbi:MAG: hypothetical protein B5M53_11440 [Candidatus Cloacimonas sp. 4484_209]|nr:MAG: hypothetical protein B5M53_11440 [Candidatus Cloacimonas sp. 4484_209]